MLVCSPGSLFPCLLVHAFVCSPDTIGSVSADEQGAGADFALTADGAAAGAGGAGLEDGDFLRLCANPKCECQNVAAQQQCVVCGMSMLLTPEIIKAAGGKGNANPNTDTGDSSKSAAVTATSAAASHLVLASLTAASSLQLRSHLVHLRGRARRRIRR
jgi:hypothetical protein